MGTIFNARPGLPIEVGIVRPDVVIQCTNPSAGCNSGEVRALPGTVSAASPLPLGFTAVVNVPGGGASRNVRRPDLIPGVNSYLNNDRSLLNPAAFATPAPFGLKPCIPLIVNTDLAINSGRCNTARASFYFSTTLTEGADFARESQS